KAAYKLSPDDKLTAGILFDDAIAGKDFALAEEIADKATTLNFDDCEGDFFVGRLAMAKGDFSDANQRFDSVLEQKPIFPLAYVLKSMVDVELGNFDSAVESIRTATMMVPLDSAIARQNIDVLQKRNKSLGSNITALQQVELEDSLLRACALNPQDWKLYSDYANLISNREPVKALTVVKQLAKRFPNSQTYYNLGKMALTIAVKETSNDRKQVLFDTAGEALSKLLELSPDDGDTKKIYAEYLRITGQNAKATEMFSGDKNTMWLFYLNNGEYEKAKEILVELYSASPEDTQIIRGLMLIAERTRNKDDAKLYSDKLLAVDNSITNELLQIEQYLKLELLQDAEVKLASFRERNPEEELALLLEAWVVLIKGNAEELKEQKNILYKESLTLVNHYLATDPENSTAWRLRGQINSSLDDFDQSISDLQKSKGINSNPDIQILLAQAYDRAGRTQEAIGELMNACQDGRTPASARVMLESLYTRTKQWSNLERFYAETISKYPESSFWYYRAGSLAIQQGKFDQAERNFYSSMKNSEKDDNKGGLMAAFDGYLTSLRMGKKYDQLFAEGAKHVSGDLAPVAYNQMGIAEMLLSNNDKAIANYHRALETAGDNYDYLNKILNSMGSVLGEDEVTKWCTDKLSEDINHLSANLMMFNINLTHDEYAKGIEYIDRVIELASKEDLTKGENLIKWVEYAGKKAQLLLVAYMKTGERPYLVDSIKQHEIIIEKNPSNTSVMNNLAFLLADNDEQLDKALNYAKRSHEASPGDANKMDTYAFVLYKLKRYDEAEEMSKKALGILELSSAATDWSMHEHLGMAQEGLGKKIEAKTSYEKSLEAAEGVASEKDITELKDAIKRVS
ncbi:MAG: hypothetical protein KAS23_00515, partial [Anaerohalosphaera sp.]|nr:hypothetical protein [Anaerohalosphaera sp.]